MAKNRDYSRGKIYKVEPIVDHEKNEIYIGSTTKEYLSQRMATHKGDYTRWKNNKRGKVMIFDLFDKYGCDHCEIILIENYIATTKDDLLSREKYFIQSLACLNKYIPGRTLEEYKRENKDILNEKERQRNSTIERINYMKERYETNKEEKLEQARIRYQEKKDEIKEKVKKHRENLTEEKKKEQYLKQREKIACVCGCYTARSDMAKHMKSKKHELIMNSNI